MSKKTIRAVEIESELSASTWPGNASGPRRRKRRSTRSSSTCANISTITDYLVICSAQSEPQIKAIANGVEQALKEEFERHPLAVDGFPTSQWIVIDYGDVMFHIFHEQKRAVYALEDLWSDAPQVSTLPAEIMDSRRGLPSERVANFCFFAGSTSGIFPLPPCALPRSSPCSLPWARYRASAQTREDIVLTGGPALRFMEHGKGDVSHDVYWFNFVDASVIRLQGTEGRGQAGRQP